MQQYFAALLCNPKPQDRLEQVPAGLIAIKPELMSMGSKFISLVNYNKTVYGPFYVDIIRKLMFSDGPPSPAPAAAGPPQDAPHNSVAPN